MAYALDDNTPQWQNPGTPQPIQQPAAQANPSINKGTGVAPITIIAIVAAIALIAAVLFITLPQKGNASTTSTVPANTNLSSNGSVKGPIPAPSASAKTMMTNDLSATSSAQNLQVSYSLNLSGVGSILGNNISISEYKLGNDSKLITSFDLLGEQATTAVFDENNTDVACTESAYTQLTCSLANKTTANTNLFHLAKTFNLSQVNVTYLGQGSVVGRPCDIFYVNGSQAAISQFYGNTSLSSSNSSAGSNATYRIGMCIDKQTGIPLKLNVSEISYSQLLGRNQKGQVVTIIATNMSVGTVTHKELNIPSTVILDKSSAGGLFNYIDCNSTALYFNVTPTSKMSRLNITLNESVYDFNTSSYENTTIIKTSRTGNYNPFVNYSIVLPDNNTPNGRIDICINGECNTGFYCYFNSTGGYNTTVNTTQ